MDHPFVGALGAILLCAALLTGCAGSEEIATAGNALSADSSSVSQDAGSANSSASNLPSETGEEPAMQQSISTATVTIDGASFAIDLADNQTAAAFAAMLPLQVDMSELNGNEKYVYLDSPLPVNASNPGTIDAGDVMFYGDNCLVVFYEPHVTSYSYTRIGKITDTSGLAAAVGTGAIEAQFALVQK